MSSFAGVPSRSVSKSFTPDQSPMVMELLGSIALGRRLHDASCLTDEEVGQLWTLNQGQVSVKPKTFSCGSSAASALKKLDSRSSAHAGARPPAVDLGHDVAPDLNEELPDLFCNEMMDVRNPSCLATHAWLYCKTACM